MAPEGVNRFFLPDGYAERLKPRYYVPDDLDWQPDVYRIAERLAPSFDCSTLIDVGCGSGRKALSLSLDVVAIDYGPIAQQAEGLFGAVFDQDLEDGMPNALLNDTKLLARSVVVCADVIEHLRDPSKLLDDLAFCCAHSPVVLISTPDRDLVRGPDDRGPPANEHHVREWNRAEFCRLLGHHAIPAEVTYTIDNDRDRNDTTLLATVLRR
jgi:SAM-dependent methyltransferase